MKIRSHTELDVYKIAFEASMKIFDLTKTFPNEEKYTLSDQIRRSSRSVCANLAEAFRKRKYPKSFVSKLSDSEAEAAETYELLNKEYENIIGKLVNMSLKPEQWSY